MKENYSIYKFTFSDGKVYIGQTGKPVEERWKNGEGYSGQEVYVPITLDGWDNVKKEILHTGLSSEQADKLEKYYIKKFNSRINGYNRTDGGKGNSSNKESEINLIELRDTLEKPILLKLPYLHDLSLPNRLISFPELFSHQKSNDEIIYEDRCGAYITTYQDAANCRDVFVGGEGHYTNSYLSNWRCWKGNPDIKTIINTPWLTLEEVQPYNLTFLRDKKAKNYAKKYNSMPSNIDKGFYNFDYASNSYLT